MNVAVIPARGGSKRIPRKNIQPFLGVPLIERAIGIVKRTVLFDRIIVSTDDDEIAGLAAKAGADVPFRRPATDTSTTLPSRLHQIPADERQREPPRGAFRQGLSTWPIGPL